jgi:hypothetical protein
VDPLYYRIQLFCGYVKTFFQSAKASSKAPKLQAKCQSFKQSAKASRLQSFKAGREPGSIPKGFRISGSLLGFKAHGAKELQRARF